MKPLYIFDLDGTLALIDHRRPILDDLSNPHRWDDFYRACVNDKPNMAVVRIFQELKKENVLFIFSGRSNLVYKETILWLEKYKIFTDPYPYGERCRLKMRNHGDYTPDEILKRSWLEEMKPETRIRIVAIFDDRQKVVDMWRSMGITCLQVAPGNF